METLRATTPVFTDESGRRATVLQWVARGLCACFVLVAAAIAFTLVTHVPLPGLGGLVAPSTTESAPETPRDAVAGSERELGTGPTADSAERERSAQGERSATIARARPTAPTTRQLEAVSKPPETGSATPASQPQAVATAAPTSTVTKPQPQSQAGKNPHAVAKSANSSKRATPQPNGNSANSHATAGRANAEAHRGGQKSTPPGATK